MSYRAAMPTFAGGEIAPSLAVRYDTAKYQTALDRARNTLGMLGGGQYNRPGFEFGARHRHHDERAYLMPFVFAANQSYALEWTDQTLRVFSGGAPVIRPRLTITGITQAAQAVVTVPSHGYSVGWDVFFDGVEGMTEINGRTARIVSIDGDNLTLDIDTSGFSAFTGDTGGVPGDDGGGSGGYPPVDPDAPPPDIPYNPTPPPTKPGEPVERSLEVEP